GQGEQIAARAGTSRDFREVERLFAQYRSVHAQLAAFESNAQFPAAIALAVGPDAVEAPLADHLDKTLSAQFDAAQQQFQRSAAEAGSALGGLEVGIPLVVALWALLALAGVWLRLGEYR